MLKILLVDDSKSAQLKTSSIMSKIGQCDQAYNGIEAVGYHKDALEANIPYDLILMDVIMPEMDGFAAAKEIMAREEESGVPADDRVKIIMLTSKTDPGNMIKAQFEIGVPTYITKPYDEQTLFEAIGNLGLL